MNEKKSLILMVEDEEQVLNANCRMLRRRGYDVRTAQTVSEVYHQLEEQLLEELLRAIHITARGVGVDIGVFQDEGRRLQHPGKAEVRQIDA